ncbi:hypothetical protein [Sphingobacterium sp.]|uniref:hypothetical protein n=1 Tax=Sphingobacterium sp. TaxID=341027 RepID=UPI0031D0B934
MSTTTHQPYTIRQVDLSDLSLLKKVQHTVKNKSLLHMPFLVLAQNKEIAAVSSATVSENNNLTVEVSYRAEVSEDLSTVFKRKAQAYFEQQLLNMFGDEESLKRGIRYFHDWVNPSGNSKLV